MLLLVISPHPFGNITTFWIEIGGSHIMRKIRNLCNITQLLNDAALPFSSYLNGFRVGHVLNAVCLAAGIVYQSVISRDWPVESSCARDAPAALRRDVQRSTQRRHQAAHAQGCRHRRVHVSTCTKEIATSAHCQRRVRSAAPGWNHLEFILLLLLFINVSIQHYSMLPIYLT